MRELGYTGQMPLLKQKFISKDARLHVANNKALIRILNQRNTDIAMLERLSHHLISLYLFLMTAILIWHIHSSQIRIQRVYRFQTMIC